MYPSVNLRTMNGGLTFNFFRPITSNHKLNDAHEIKYNVLESTPCLKIFHRRKIGKISKENRNRKKFLAL